MGFDYKTSTGLGETDSSPGGHKQNLAHTKTQRKAVTPQETEANLPASAGRSPVEVWVGRGSPQGQRSLAGYSPWGCKESDMTEHLSTCC